MLSIRRIGAMMTKEFLQMRRDRITFAMMVGIPLMQLILFGFAINSDPKHLPTAIINNDNSIFSRTIVAAMQASEYFRVTALPETEFEAEELVATGEAMFVLIIPHDFGHDLIRGDRPVLLIQADATDPMSVGQASKAVEGIARSALERDFTGPLQELKLPPNPVDLRIHAQYNPEGITQVNIVPGLMGVVLTMTLVIITALAITRERERGTMENLLITPVRPLEVMIGKIIPYIVVGYIQMTLILVAAKIIFNVPFQGSLPLLYMVSLIFIAANLSMGITFSTLASNQLQAVQMAFFFFLPSILLSGFMFPFRGMPEWAQYIGSALPLTHFLRIVRGILLKGNTLYEILPHIWPLALFLTVVLSIAVKRYRQTLD